jgi:hypothetical protein
VPAAGGTGRILERPQPTNEPGSLAWWPRPEILYRRPGNQEHTLIDPATGSERPLRIDAGGGYELNPTYSPRGDKVALFCNCGGPGLWILPVDGGAATQISKENVAPFAWTAEGTLWTLAAERGVSTLVAFRPAAGGWSVTRRPLSQRASSIAVALPGGKEFLALVNEVTTDVWVVDDFDPANR